MSQKFFNPASKFGGFDGWEIQNENPTTGQDRAQALGADGDEIASHLHNTKTTVTESFVCIEDEAEIPDCGKIVSGWHIDTVTVTLSNTGFATMSVTGHKHGTANHANCRNYAGTYTEVASMFGCPDELPCCTIPADAGVRSVTYTKSVNHVDELGSDGEWLAADNYDGTESFQVELCDAPAANTFKAKTGWDATSLGSTRGNTVAETASGTFEKHIAHTVAST